MVSDKIRIFVSMHDEFYIPDNKLLVPIQVGTALANKRLDGMLYDDEGINISAKNKMYCELTAQYWAWKNQPDLEYYGFFHYRRYLSFNPVNLENYENIVYFDYCDNEAIKKLKLEESVMERLIRSYDVIYPQENPIGGDTVYEHWIKHLNKKDLDTLVDVIMEKYPQFYKYTKEVLNAKQAIHCNMFIMKKEYFNEYSEWLFDILEECEKRSNYEDYSTEWYRTLGHLGERLCAIYSKYLEDKKLKICYVQRTLFKNVEKSAKVDIVNENNLVPILLACNNAYVKYTSVLIESIQFNSSPDRKYAIYLLHKDIQKENMQILLDQVADKDNISIEFINVGRNLAEYNGLFVDRHLSVETYFRFFSIDIFPKLDKILYLDCDTVVNDDLAKLFDLDLEGKSLGVTRDVDIISLYPKENKTDIEVHDNIDINIGLQHHTDYFQAGVIIFNLAKIREKFTVNEIFDIAMRRKWKFQDQDILNCLFKGDVKYIPLRWNTLYECFNRLHRVKVYTSKELSMEYIAAKEKPSIIHYAGTPKPWDDMYVDLGNYFWKYAQISPMFEILLHELNIKSFKSEKKGRLTDNVRPSANNKEIEELQKQVNTLQWSLDETRKSFTYRVGRFITYIPRKLRGMKKQK